MKEKSLNKALKIGIMGGIFDPIHNGHLLLAENAASQFHLDQVLFIPTGNPPHKKTAGILDAKYRCDMISLAIAGNDKFELSMREVLNPEVCYTYRTLTALKEEKPENEYYFIMGADSLFYFEKWRKPEVICQKASILAAVRDDVDEKALQGRIDFLCKKFDAKIYELNTPNFSVSSHDIRKRIQQGKTTRYLLPDEVREYIIRENLYQQEQSFQGGQSSVKEH